MERAQMFVFRAVDVCSVITNRVKEPAWPR